jgi:ribose transport system ATP-binding protein
MNMVLAALAKIALALLGSIRAAGIIDPRRGNRLARQLIERLRIRSRGPTDLPLNLSGGNRQKVVLSKWLLQDNKLLVLHNPTRGVDVAGYADIHALIDELAAGGAGILLISDSLS